MIRRMTVDSPLGALTIVQEDDAIIALLFEAGDEHDESPLLLQAARELDEYFCGERRVFTVPLRPRGTPFQLRCWEALCRIPYGQTISYARQAAMIGNPRACRAVGMANHHNPLPIFIPCHRTVGSNGSLTGYAGGLTLKEKLLTIERTTQP